MKFTPAVNKKSIKLANEKYMKEYGDQLNSIDVTEWLLKDVQSWNEKSFNTSSMSIITSSSTGRWLASPS